MDTNLKNIPIQKDEDKTMASKTDNITTENGAPSLNTTNDPRLNLFFKTVRDIGNLDVILPLVKTLRQKNIKRKQELLLKEPELYYSSDTEDVEKKLYDNKNLYDLIDKSLEISELDTLKIIFNWRDCRGGKGDHEGFIVAFQYFISKFSSNILKQNLDNIVKYGCYLDLIKLWHCFKNNYLNEKKADIILKYISKQLIKDKMTLELYESGTAISEESKDNKTDKNISLLAKWIPSENSHWDIISCNAKPHSPMSNTKRDLTHSNRFLINLCRYVFNLKDQFVTPEYLKRLRKEYLVPLRKHLKIVETNITSKDYETIDFEKVPSVAMKKYYMLFAKHVTERYSSYLYSVKSGTKKINSSQVYPHDLVRNYLQKSTNIINDVVEEQWKVINFKVRSSGVFNNSLVICDVSNSMIGTPMEVAIAFSILGMNDRQIITFSEIPEIHNVIGDTLYSQVNSIKNMKWGLNTNFESVCDLILQMDKQIDKLFIFSDMQFDQALAKSSKTHFENLKQEFEILGKKMPTIIFWNLRGNTKDFPVYDNENNVILLSGYSPSLLNFILENTEITPLSMLMNIINNTRYDSVKFEKFL
jgi:hypothetical protein